MYDANSYFAVAVILLVIVGTITAVLRWHKGYAAESRLQRMMLSCGIDKETAARAERLQILDMGAVRSRCRICPVTDLCNRWLDGEAVPSNSFCQNAWYFGNAAGS